MATKKNDPQDTQPGDAPQPERVGQAHAEPEVADDVRNGPLNEVGDPKDNPVLPDDVSAIADPEDPTQIMDPGEDPDFNPGGKRTKR